MRDTTELIPSVEITTAAGATFRREFEFMDTVDILSSTETSPIVIVATDHGIDNGDDDVLVENHEENTAANGRWTATKIDDNSLSLNGSTGNGAGVKTGQIGKPTDLTGLTWTCKGRELTTDDSPLAEMDVDVDGGTVTLMLEAETCTTLAGKTVTFDLKATNGDDEVEYWLRLVLTFQRMYN